MDDRHDKQVTKLQETRKSVVRRQNVKTNSLFILCKC